MLDALLLFSAVFAVSAAAPGADTMLMFGRALGGGARGAVPVAVGITLGKLVLLALAAAGVTAAAAALGPLFVAVKAAGAAYLIWLGVRAWRRSPEAARRAAPVEVVSFGRGLAAGAALAVSNPQALLFYVAVLPGVADEGAPVTQYVAFGGVLLVVMACVAAVYIFLGARARTAAASPGASRYTNRLVGATLIAAGLLVVAS